MAEESFKLQFLQTMSALMISAFGLVAALAWNETIKKAIAELTGSTFDDPNLWGLLVYALLVTVIAVAATMLITRSINKAKKELQEKEYKQ